MTKALPARSGTCVFAASEVAGLAKTGGLADVAAALPRALSELGWRVIVIAPLYRCVRSVGLSLETVDPPLAIPMADRREFGKLHRARLPHSNVELLLVEQAHYFERDDQALRRGLYQFTNTTGDRVDYPDNCERFVFFSRAILEALRILQLAPEILHLNDWQTGLVATYVAELKRQTSRDPFHQALRNLRTVFTIHNLAYQGLFWHYDMPILGLPWRVFTPQRLEFYGRINFLKAGIVDADYVTTVSPTYAREIQTPYFGCGLQGLLMSRARVLHGIVNGIDPREWNPATDRHLTCPYDATTVGPGKSVNKSCLQQRLGLESAPTAPLLGVISRLVDQKGIDLLITVLPVLMERGAQVAILGDGDRRFHDALEAVRRQHPRQLSLTFGFHEALAHQIEAGADMFLMPSRYEPCGLNQLYSLKYGTVPIVRATGGLADTVVDATEASRAAGTATGFTFVAPAPDALLHAVDRALQLYRNDPSGWRHLMETGMLQDWSWTRSAAEYDQLYRRGINSW